MVTLKGRSRWLTDDDAGMEELKGKSVGFLFPWHYECAGYVKLCILDCLG